jgi:amidase
VIYCSASELARALKARRVSAVELAQSMIDRIERLDPSLNAVVVRDFERALAAARSADEALARGDQRPLLGVPMTVKEAFNVADLPTTWGLPGTSEIPVSADAVVVKRLKAAGAIILGKTNLAMMLADWQCANPVYGVTKNPWDLERTPGGSSGGGAAALAAGFTPLEFGSDLAASLRAPPAFCGVYAHKPSFDLVPTRGLAPPGAPTLSVTPIIDMAVVGPMARTASDLALALDCTAGPDEHEATAWRLELPAPRRRRLRDYRVLAIDTHPRVPTADSVRAAIEARAVELERLGVSVARQSPLLPDLGVVADTFGQLLLAIFAADGPAGGPSHADWIRADRTRAEIVDQMRRLFETFDVVLCPAMPTAAPPLNGSAGPPAMLEVDGVSVPYQAQPLWAALANLTGGPATMIPVGVDRAGLPIGAQIMGPYLEDRTCLHFAQLMEDAIGGFVAPPAWENERSPQGSKLAG